jgi:hypothetical protein
MNKYRVWIRSTPGFYEQYDGKVDVFAEDEEQARERALQELWHGAFPDRGRSMWKIERVEVLRSRKYQAH